MNIVIILFTIALIIAVIMHLRHPMFYFTDKDGLKGGRWSVAAGVTEKGGEIKPDVILSYDDLPDDTGKGFIADPFFIKHNSAYYLFVEYFHNFKGVIAYYESSDFKNWDFKDVVLEERFHLSYPQVFKDDDGSTYMLPEASKSNKLTLYIAVDFPDKWERYSVLLDDIKVIDPSLVKIDGYYYVFFVDEKRIQRVFISNKLHEGWKEHKSSPLGIGNYKRPGGRIFKQEGRYYLPVQSARYGYGSSLEKRRIEVITPGKIKISRKKTLLKPFRNTKYFLHGTHHLDMQKLDGKLFYVLDGRGTEKKSIFILQIRACIVKNVYDIMDFLGIYKFLSVFK